MIERTDHLTKLVCESVEAGRDRCSECGDVGPKGMLFIYATERGARRRVHDGTFCSKLCHDRFHGLAPKRKA